MAVSPERLVREYLLSVTAVDNHFQSRIATTLPPEPTMPFLTIQLVGGGPEDGEAPIDLYLIQHDALGSSRSEADVGFRLLLDAYRDHVGFVGTHGTLRTVQVSSVRRADDVDALDRYGFQVDAFVQVS